jgi:Ca-activated chloride channel family protein
MKRRAAIRNLLIAGAAFFVPRHGRPQGAPQVPKPAPDVQKDFVIHSDVRLVLLDVSVQDRGGGFVEGLQQSSFTVLENGIVQQIRAFANIDVPVTVGVLVDESRSMTPKRNEVLSAAGTFIAESNPRDEIFVLNFNETVKRGLPPDVTFTDNADQLRAALYRGVPEGRTAMNDAVVEGLIQLDMGRRDKKALVLISDGGDNASRHTRRGMLDMLERSLATIYAVGLFDLHDADRNPAILKQLAKISGGEAFFPDEPSDMTTVCRTIAKEIRTRYTIGYVPPEKNGSSPVRHIRVNVSAPGHPRLVARTRTSYRYEEPANSGSR